MRALRGQGPYLGQAESRNKRNRIYIFTYNGNRASTDVFKNPLSNLSIACHCNHV